MNILVQKSKKLHKWHPKTPTIYENRYQNPCNIYERSRLRRGCVLGPFWCRSGVRGSLVLDPFWRQFSTKKRKKAFKRHPQIEAEKGWTNSAEIVGKSSQNGVQNLWKNDAISEPAIFWFLRHVPSEHSIFYDAGVPTINHKSMQNRCLKKWCKTIKKNGANMGAKINDKSITNHINKNNAKNNR